ncbi:MAG TPA: regulatory iron-sulfur-containing complex subunit RicT [Gemmatimonadaceae bacterium]|nr:regulatory iron-sulfur-containing complex subunit RicT [Gemmatimonadaceae bacterium]
MSQVIEVAFKGNRKDFYLWESEEAPAVRATIIVDADRGEDLGRVHATGDFALKRLAGTAHGAGVQPSKRALRLATREDERRAAELGEQNEQARRKAMERVKANGLVMKLSDAEWQWDRKKLTFYFTAEKRVDFRNLVRELAAMFRTRIELKQIGVRDEAKRLDGIGRCGRQYCSAAWLPELRPVNLGVAKDQRLSLNPSQISGACGRLMCSLRYEHEFYVQSRKRFPKEGKILVTARGEEKVVSNDIFNNRVTLRSPEGETRVVALADLRREMAEPAGAADAADAVDAADLAPDATDAADATVADSADAIAFEEAAPAPVRAAAPAAPAAPPDANGSAEDDEDDGEDEEDAAQRTAAAGAGLQQPGATPEGGDRPLRRRRGRRGGRRGRGGSGGSGGGGSAAAGDSAVTGGE